MHGFNLSSRSHSAVRDAEADILQRPVRGRWVDAKIGPNKESADEIVQPEQTHHYQPVAAQGLLLVQATLGRPLCYDEVLLRGEQEANLATKVQQSLGQST